MVKIQFNAFLSIFSSGEEKNKFLKMFLSFNFTALIANIFTLALTVV